MTEPQRADSDALRLPLLVLRCQAGDEKAFAQLLEQFGGRTLGYLRALVGEDAEDVQQEVWLSVYRHVAQLADPAAFRTWLFRTARHRAIDHLRRRRRERELFVETEDVELLADPGAGADLADAAGWTGLLEQLSPLHREALMLRHHDDMSYADIALVVGCPVGTVRSRLFQARHRLEQLLNARRAEPAPPA
jgi:RNA polymerase sigma-70 factor, ECF subfamily